MTDKQLLTLRIGFIDRTIHLMQHNVVEKVLDAQSQSSLGVTLLAKRFVNQDAQSCAAIEAVVIENVDTADGCSTFIQVNHQSELLVAEQVVVSQQELLYLKASVRHMRPAHPPNVAVVFPKENLTRILRFGASERYHLIFNEHGCLSS